MASGKTDTKVLIYEEVANCVEVVFVVAKADALLRALFSGLKVSMSVLSNLIVAHEYVCYFSRFYGFE